MKNRLVACSTVALLFTVIVISMRVASHKESEGHQQVQELHPRKISLASREMSAGRKQQIVANSGQVPLSFEANRGQTNPQVRFVSHSRGYSLFLTDNEAVLALGGSGRNPTVERPMRPKQNSELDPPRPSIEDSKLGMNSSPAVLRFKLLGANPSPHVTGTDELPGKSNYFLGNDPTRWRTNLPTYAKVKYQSVYPGIDLHYHGNQRQLEYDFMVAPGAHPQAIRMSFRGAERMEIDAHGDLVLHTAAGEVREHKPVAYQEIAGERQVIAARYIQRGGSEVGFAVAPYDTHELLIIDPVLSYATYLGGSGGDGGEAIAVDAAGNVYVTGYAGNGFPTTAGAFQTTPVTFFDDAFVTKLSPDGSALIYSTYLGGSYEDVAYGIAVDSTGNAYVTGDTGSSNFPTTPDAFQTTYRGVGFHSRNAFATKLSADGSALIYSTYLGGMAIDSGNGIAVDSEGKAYLTGDTTSTNFPTTPGSLQPVNGGGFPGDAFVTKLSADGSTLTYSTYLGGSDEDVGYGIAVDSAGNAYVTGYAFSVDFPTTAGAFQTTLSAGVHDDAFVSKLNASGSALIYSSYLGGGDHDGGFSIAVDATGSAYVTGFTSSADFPTSANAFQTNFAGGLQTTFGPGEDAFVTKLNANGSVINYSSYLGGGLDEAGYGIAVDSANNAYLTGPTSSIDFPTTPDAFQTTFGGGKDDAFVTELNSTGSALMSSTYVGGSDDDVSIGVGLDSVGNAYVTGFTASADFPSTAGAFQTTNGGGTDAFVTKVSPPPDFSLTASALSPGTVSPGGLASSTVDVAAISGFSDSVTLACSVRPSPALAPRCSIPSSVNSEASVTLSVSTTGPSARALPSNPGSGPLYAVSLPLLGLAVAGFGSRHRKKGRTPVAMLACLLFAGLAFVVACGGGNHSGGGGGTPAGTYTITVTGTSGSVAHSTSAMLKVK